jgi:cytochrome c biogenesis protein ResB
MISCEEATRLISQSLDKGLPLRKRIALRSHLLMCKLCPRFLRQMRFLRTAAVRHERAVESDAFHALSPEAKERIKKVLSENQNSQ